MLADFTFQDPAIVESSGLVVSDGLFVTTNDSGDTGRIFTVDATGRTVGVTSWALPPTDVEALAPASPSEVWVGDIGDNTGSRPSVTVVRVPFGPGDRTVTPPAYTLVYPDGAHDAEALLAAPDGRLLVVTKELFGGTVYAAPKRLSPSHPNELAKVTRTMGVVTDGAFFPAGATTCCATTAPPRSTPTPASGRWRRSGSRTSRRARGSRWTRTAGCT